MNLNEPISATSNLDNLSTSILKQIDGICSRFERSWLELGRGDLKACFREAARIDCRSCAPLLFRELLEIDMAQSIRQNTEINTIAYQRQFPNYHSIIKSVYRAQLVRKEREQYATPESLYIDFESIREIKVNGHNRFRIIEKIGEGGMGVVYRAMDLTNHDTLALKLLRVYDLQMIQYMKAEFRALAEITHRNLIHFHELTITDDLAFISMEYIDGINFLHYAWQSKSYADRQQGFDRLCQSVFQVVQGLEAIHRRGMIHRDIKPENVLVEADGRVVLLDFGLAKDYLTNVGRNRRHETLVGTLPYMPPEQIWGKNQSPASDFFTLGVMIYVALTGRFPWMRIGESSVRPPRTYQSSVPADLDRITVALLAEDSASRPTTQDLFAYFRPEIPVRGTGFQFRDRDRIFVGRFDELLKLRQAFSRCMTGHLQILEVDGDSGIGKSHLIEHFFDQLAIDEDCLILKSRCYPQERIPYKAFDGIADGLAIFLESHSQLMSEVGLQELLRDVQRMFPGLRGSNTSSDNDLASLQRDPAGQRARAIRAWWNLIARTADVIPVVLWVDDFQWTDEDSIMVLKESAGQIDQSRIVMVFSHRCEYPDVSKHIQSLGEQLPKDAFKHIALGPLDADAIATLVEQRLHYLDPELKSTVATAEGSPFLINEIVECALSDQLQQANTMGASSTINSDTWIQRRIWNLNPAEIQILELMSLSAEPLDCKLIRCVAGVTSEYRVMVSCMCKQALLKMVGVDGREGFLPYHDRIRESIQKHMASERQVECHQGLARALEHLDDDRWGMRAHHHHGAGNLSRAGECALTAGNQSFELLAFTQAAEFYEMSLKWAPGSREHQRNLLKKEASAWEYGGHLPTAAERYYRSADFAEGHTEKRVALLKASEQWMIGGDVDQGVGVIRPLLHYYGIHFPKSGKSLELKIAINLLRLWLYRVLGSNALNRRFSEPETNEKSDCCYFLAKGLVAVIPVLGGYFAIKSLETAQHSGDPVRLARGLFLVGIGLIHGPGLLRKLAVKLLKEGCRIADRVQDSYLLAMVQLTLALEAMHSGKWLAVITSSQQGITILNEKCRGIAWERNLGTMATIRGLEEMGRFSESVGQSQRWIRECHSRGDVHEVNARLLHGFSQIFLNKIDQALDEADQAMTLYGRQEISMNHFYAMRIKAHAFLVKERPQDALEIFKTARDPLQQSGLLSTALIREDFNILYSRIVLHLAKQAPGNARWIREGRKVANDLYSSRRDYGIAFSKLTDASVAFQKGDFRSTITSLNDSRVLFATMSMDLVNACVDYQLRKLEGMCDLKKEEQTIKEVSGADPSVCLKLIMSGFF